MDIPLYSCNFLFIITIGIILFLSSPLTIVLIFRHVYISMEREVEAVEPDVSKAEARDPEWADDEFESRCLVLNHKICILLFPAFFFFNIYILKLFEEWADDPVHFSLF